MAKHKPLSRCAQGRRYALGQCKLRHSLRIMRQSERRLGDFQGLSISAAASCASGQATMSVRRLRRRAAGFVGFSCMRSASHDPRAMEKESWFASYVSAGVSQVMEHRSVLRRSYRDESIGLATLQVPASAE